MKTIILTILTLTGGLVAHAETLEQQFRELPMETRRTMSPFLWLHGDDS